MSTVRIVNGRNTVASGANTTSYGGIGVGGLASLVVEAQAQQTVRTAGTYSDLTVRVTANSVNNTSFVRFRKGGVDGNQVVSIATGATGEFTDAVNSDTVAAGDLVNYSLVVGNGGNTLTFSMFAMDFVASSNTVERFACPDGFTYNTASTTYYISIAGLIGGQNTTESIAQFKFKAAGTFRNFNVYVRTNTSTATTTLRSRINGGNGNLAISVLAAGTGQYEDASNSDTIAVNDLVCFSVTTGTGTAAFRPSYWFSDFISTAGYFHLIAGTNTGISYSANTSYYAGVGHILDVLYTTETAVYTKPNMALTLSNLEAYVNTNGITATSTIRLRKNGGDGNELVSIGSGATGWFEDTVNSDSVVATDDINYHLAVGASGTTIQISFIGILAATATATVKTITDTGAGVDNSALAASLGLTDIVLGGDFLGLAAALQLLDSGVGSDAINLILYILKSISDFGYSAESIGLQSSLIIYDTGTGDGGTGVEIILGIDDSGVGIDNPGLSASLGLTDGALGGDYLDLAALLNLPDSGSGSDSISVLSAVLKTIQDAASGLDNLSIQASLSVVELGNGQEALSIQASLIVNDTGTGVDLETVTKVAIILKQIADTASAIDGVSLTAFMTLAETSVGFDGTTLQATLSAGDVGAGVESPLIQATLSIVDASTSTDIISILQSIIKSIQDFASGSDASLSISASIPVAESGLGSDQLAQLLAYLLVSDIGTGIDVVVQYDLTLRIVKITFSLKKNNMTFSVKSPGMDFGLNKPEIDFDFTPGG